MEEIEEMTKQIGEKAGLAALQRAAYNQATAEEFQARLALLHTALRAARPALREMASKLPVLKSGPGCEIHGYSRGTVEVCAIEAVQVLPSLAVGTVKDEWAWWLDVQPGPSCPLRNCWAYEWRPISSGKVLETTPLVTVVKGILEAVDEQLRGNRLKRALQFDAKANKLRALAVLLGDPEDR